jgi:hypothetical protein
MAILLYSTNPFMKFFIQRKYMRDIHYVWCSESLDSQTLGAYASGSLVAPTSNPKDIYEDLKNAVRRTDKHNSKITQQIASLSAHAVQWETDRVITTAEKADILYMLNEPRFFSHWRPLLYVIPVTSAVTSRLRPVPAHLCASLGAEYIIEDLAGNEFDVIEL